LRCTGMWPHGAFPRIACARIVRSGRLICTKQRRLWRTRNRDLELRVWRSRYHFPPRLRNRMHPVHGWTYNSQLDFRFVFLTGLVYRSTTSRCFLRYII
jgi:hypothetical protein